MQSTSPPAFLGHGTCCGVINQRIRERIVLCLWLLIWKMGSVRRGPVHAACRRLGDQPSRPKPLVPSTRQTRAAELQSCREAASAPTLACLLARVAICGGAISFPQPHHPSAAGRHPRVTPSAPKNWESSSLQCWEWSNVVGEAEREEEESSVPFLAGWWARRKVHLHSASYAQRAGGKGRLPTFPLGSPPPARDCQGPGQAGAIA